jgi:hypothetical protein
MGELTMIEIVFISNCRSAKLARLFAADPTHGCE